MESLTMDVSQPSNEEETTTSKKEKVQKLNLKPNPFLLPMVAEQIAQYSCKRTLFSLRQVSKLYYSLTSKLCWNENAKGFVVDSDFKVPPSDFPAHIYRELSLRISSKLLYQDTLRNPGRNFIVRIAPFIIELTIGISAATSTQTIIPILQNLHNIKILNLFVSNEQSLRPNIGPIVRALGSGVKEIFIYGQGKLIGDSALQYLFQNFIQEFGHVTKVGLTGCTVLEPRTLDLLAWNLSRIARMGLLLNRYYFTTPGLQHRLEILSPVVEILGLVQLDPMIFVPWPILAIENAKWQMLKFIDLTNFNSPLTFFREFPCLERIHLTDTDYATSLFINPELPDHENVINIFGNLPGPPKKILHLRHFHFDGDCEFYRFKNKEIIDFLNGNFAFTVWLFEYLEVVMKEEMDEYSELGMDFSSSSMSLLLSPTEWTKN